MKFEIKHRFTGAILFSLECRSFKICVEAAVNAGASLAGASLDGLVATDEESISNLDKVREIIIDNAERLDMGHWHGDDQWVDRTCAEETLCGTTHCLAGWLQVCSTEEKIRNLSNTQMAGMISAPVASKMFFSENKETLTWLRDRKYVEELAK